MEETAMEINRTVIDNLIGNPLLNQWERGFMESVAEQYKKKSSLSYSQERIVKRCIEKTSVDKVEEHNEWVKNYDAKKRRIAKVIAEYYTEAGYFTNWAAKILTKPDTYVLPEKTWVKMCENRYAKKVLANLEAPKLFEVGGLATVRRAVNHNHLHGVAGSSNFNYMKVKDQAIMVLEYEVTPAQHKTVKCALLLDPTIVFRCEERRLKKHRG
jgi:hypothetical protein